MVIISGAPIFRIFTVNVILLSTKKRKKIAPLGEVALVEKEDMEDI